jgi:dTDP-4-amino-4,6-dideoxygalactose transaminase
MRCVPPVHSPVALPDLFRGAAAVAGLSTAGGEELQGTLLKDYGAGSVWLFDSGTSALIAAFRLASRGALLRVACPSYICVDVGSAAQFVGVELVLYDTDPATLSPDIDSLRRAVGSGVSAVLVAHLFGFPVAMDEVRALCDEHGLTLIEDAAQEAGARYNGQRLGSMGDLAILSFGRGKGATGGGGGALLINGDWSSKHDLHGDELSNAKQPPGWRPLIASKAQWLFGRPGLYCLPLSLPYLRLGQMVYRAAHEPRGISRASAAILSGGRRIAAAATEGRRAMAERYSGMIGPRSRLTRIAEARGAEASYLRFPVKDISADRAESRRLGIVRGYPKLLDEEVRLRATVVPGGGQRPGAAELRDRLFTLPTHSQVQDVDVRRILAWITGPG